MADKKFKEKEQPFLVVVSASSQKEAILLANRLLEKRLAACVNVAEGVTSFFIWKGKKEKAREVLLFIKTLSSRFEKLETHLRKHHSYEVPEIIGLPIKKSSKPYLAWLRESVKLSS